MSFSTFSSEQHRLYCRRLFTLVFLPALVLFGFGVYLQPISGDLTRVGYYPERTFGWLEPQAAFSAPRYKVGKYNAYRDVVILGDSFALARPKQQWQNYLAKETGWSITVLDVDKYGWKKLLASPVFIQSPPKLVIYESVERALASRIQTMPSCSENRHADGVFINHGAPHGLPGVSTPLSNPEQHQIRHAAWSKIKLGFVLKYLWKNAIRELTGKDKTGARKISLQREAPLSSVNKKDLLVYKNDVVKDPLWQSMNLTDWACRIYRLKEQIEANGKTRFVLLAAPDKLTAYGDFIADKKLRDLSRLGVLLDALSDVAPRDDIALQTAIRSGTLDVYLPNDTHWGANGHRIVAEALFDFLHQR